jgi:hypothetical protein
MEQFAADGLGTAAMEYIDMVDSIREGDFPSLRYIIAGVGSSVGVVIACKF